MDTLKKIKYLEPIAQRFDATMLDYLELIATHAVPMKFNVGDAFPGPAQEDYSAACIVEGVFRTISKDSSNKECTVRFSAEGDFSMFIQQHNAFDISLEYRMEAITSAVMLIWEREALDLLNQKIPNWYILNLKIFQTIILRLTVERGEMFGDDATVRYRKFAARYPHILARVPLRYVANYLGIAPQSLSRIRQQIAKSSNS